MRARAHEGVPCTVTHGPAGHQLVTKQSPEINLATSALSSPTVESKDGSLATPFRAPETLITASASAMQNDADQRCQSC
jgi:hypothetical protein